MTNVGPSTEQNPTALYLLAMLLAFQAALSKQEFIAVQAPEWIPYPIPDSSLQWETRCFPVLKMQLITFFCVLTYLLL